MAIYQVVFSNGASIAIEADRISVKAPSNAIPQAAELSLYRGEELVGHFRPTGWAGYVIKDGKGERRKASTIPRS